MPMIDVTAADETADDARVRSNVVRLAAAQALTGANSAVIFATGSIIGATLAPNISLATVPLSMYVLGLAAGTLPTGAISRAYGRRVAFIIGTGCGVLTGLLGSFAILHASFWLFCCATFLGGLYGAVSQSYRFAAADGASVAYRPKAVSWVMAGGVFAGVLGPQLVQWTMDIWLPYLFASASWCRRRSRCWRWRCCPASMRRSPRHPICTAAARCSRSRGSRASSRLRCAASSSIR
jgi:MFS family permease